jgi:hypothetical protein
LLEWKLGKSLELELGIERWQCQLGRRRIGIRIGVEWQRLGLGRIRIGWEYRRIRIEWECRRVRIGRE